MSPADEIVTADAADGEALSSLIALAFHQLAPSVWLIPGSLERRRVLPRYFHLLVDDALERGRVYTTAGRTAAALWFPVAEAGAPAPVGYEEALAAATGPWHQRFRTFDGHLDKHHPGGLRHDHLAILAVHPDWQRRGLGTALLAAHHAVLDRTDSPTAAYLEASGADTRELYLRHGYSDFGEPIQLPGGPNMYPMLRPARPADGPRPTQMRAS